MKSGDIIFVKGHGIIERLIEFFDKGRFSHVVIAVSDKDVLEAQYGTKSRVIPFYFESYEIVDLCLSELQRNRVKELSKELIGHKYDFIQVISYLIKDTFDRKFKVINNPNNYICSELVEVILQDIGVISNDKRLKNLTPNELYKYLITLK